jgi:hypothetical protein
MLFVGVYSMTNEIQVKELLDSVRGDRSLAEKILAIFPGYKGYKEKELLRETDRIVRERLFSMLKEAVNDLRYLYRDIISAQGDSSLARESEKIYYRSDALAEKVRHAPYGYKPFFHAVRADSEDLYKLVQYDASLASDISSFKNLIDDIKKRAPSMETSLSEVRLIDQTLRSLEAKIAERDQILLKVAG